MNRLLYEGKAKRVWTTPNPDELVIEFKDSLTAFDGRKCAELKGKGELNCRISARFFKLLSDSGVENHLIRQLDQTRLLVRALKMIQLEAVVRNRAAGHILARLGLAQGHRFNRPIVEFYYKNDALGDPLVNQDHISELELTSPEELVEMRQLSLKVNDLLSRFLSTRGIELIDFKLEFGRYSGKTLVGDEITPDTCRFWDRKTEEILDKDRFRKDLGGVLEAYQEILKRISPAEPGCPDRQDL